MDLVDIDRSSKDDSTSNEGPEENVEFEDVVRDSDVNELFESVVSLSTESLFVFNLFRFSSVNL